MSGEQASQPEQPELDPQQQAEAEAAIRAQEAAASELPGLLAGARAADAGPDERRAFWQAIFRLPHWIFVAQGGTDEPRPLVVYAGADGATPTLLAFSRPEDAVRTAMDAGLDGEAAQQLLAVPMPAAAEFAASFAGAGVAMLQVEAHDEGGLVIPLEFVLRARDDLVGAPAAE